jgi:hypothetical protein
MGKQFTKLSVKVKNGFNLAGGLQSSAGLLESVKFYGPNGSKSDLPGAFDELNNLASNNTKYTSINIKTEQTVASTPPLSRNHGDLWFNTSQGVLMVYVDGTGWVQTN